MYRRYRNYSKPKVRTITVKYAGECECCGKMIQPGSMADYYPVGTIAGVHKPAIAHIGGLDGKSTVCFNELKRKQEDKGLNDYAGDGLDARYEDSCKDSCGL